MNFCQTGLGYGRRLTLFMGCIPLGLSSSRSSYFEFGKYRFTNIFQASTYNYILFDRIHLKAGHYVFPSFCRKRWCDNNNNDKKETKSFGETFPEELKFNNGKSLDLDQIR